MNIGDLPFEEQLMHLSAEPKAGPELQSPFLGLMWPDADTLKRQSSESALADSELIDDTIDWIDMVLKPEWVDPDLQSRLVAATGVVNRPDAFLARYTIGNAKIQIIVTRFSIHLVISSGCGLRQVEALACANAFLNVQFDPENPWIGGPWAILPVDGFMFGYQRLTRLREWRDSLDYLSDGRAVKFSIRKVPPQPLDSKPGKTGHGPTEQAESRWFQSRDEKRNRSDESESDY